MYVCLFSPEKTAVVVFSKKPVNTDHLTKLKMYNEEIQFQTQTKYLGVIFDSQLSFRPHVNQKFVKARRLLFENSGDRTLP
jgi:hypothetical protein